MSKIIYNKIENGNQKKIHIKRDVKFEGKRKKNNNNRFEV